MNDVVQIALRAFFALVVLFAITRFSGKKQLAQLTFFEYIVGITIGDITAVIATDIENNLVHGYTSLLVFAAIPFFVDYLSLKSKFVRQLFEGKGTVLVKNGKILEDNLKKEHINTDELLAQLRLKNMFKVADVEFAILETNGQLSVMPKKDAQPVTVKDLQLNLPAEVEPETVIMDGQVLLDPLRASGRTAQWLDTELKKTGVKLENVFLGQVDDKGALYLDLYNDQLQVPQPSENQLLLATLKKCQADFEMFALETQNKEAKRLYSKAADKLQHTIEQVNPYLR
ncbi:DUF421 domain-containing protein [Aneurinibacillus aneurinilyticus]|jgi:uncharacterized membrane protein YcaP (DUF421 family)|uniref:DUF421 domain-containing protein n=2 Tax=Aneurinibacillus aneurinilyticus TaxID=1391 RepID=A0A848CZC8_ANEAE|nr:DUF421 domain-containing protein [Aneurinibacillus aneurinilyticus]ERI09005.1 hypothetical protein HMPREF0083_02905 [Aneurinibacillus aneurinilyticus ATCC 12856]MCI1695770.1 DUF421 domain-containing protein [Aneurinibacillus aneurinilyticus]MED0673952.1 DUF421 domain-containing protein [Aneurinibacillus aneurinilyticus]MED0709575.1 DUF421 domain-containing protein [Aneurinibacillus aneurinilyticus]MED0723423.1 DUF421 domain-containing protein [Aneurinibacillus aneurinilyticus]